MCYIIRGLHEALIEEWGEMMKHEDKTIGVTKCLRQGAHEPRVMDSNPSAAVVSSHI